MIIVDLVGSSRPYSKFLLRCASFLKLIDSKGDSRLVIIIIAFLFSVDFVKECLGCLIVLSHFSFLSCDFLARLFGCCGDFSWTCRFLFTSCIGFAALLFNERSAGVFFFLTHFIVHNKLHDIFHLKGISVHCRLNILLLFGSFDDLLFHSPFSYYSVNCHRFGLADSVGPVCGLLVHCRVPVVVVKNHSVSRDQIDSKTTGSCRKEERKNIVVSLVLFHHIATILDGSLTIQPEECHLFPSQEVL